MKECFKSFLSLNLISLLIVNKGKSEHRVTQYAHCA